MYGLPVIACVKWGERYGAYYANALYAMVRHHLSGDFIFQCFTDDPQGLDHAIITRELPVDLVSWWNKLHLFKEGVFAPDQRVIYFDLDTVILEALDDIVRYSGEFALLRDFYRPHGYGSGVMLWRAGACHSIWSSYEAAGRPLLQGGDQAWIEKAYPYAARLQDIFPRAFISYKTDCAPLPPEGARVLCFHGEPKQDNCDAPWVRDLWRVNPSKQVISSSISLQQEREVHTQHANSLSSSWLVPMAAHARHAVIVGGGPTLNDCVEKLRQEAEAGHDVFAVNGVSAWLGKKSIHFHAHVMCHASEEHAALVPHDEVTRYYSSTCHPKILERAGKNLALWQPVPRNGETAGLQAIGIAHTLGYRHFHLYGFDSCMKGKEHHAYVWPQGDGERVFEAETHGRQFAGAMWMLRQADQFLTLGDRLLREGCTISIHGDGMLHHLAMQATLKASLVYRNP